MMRTVAWLIVLIGSLAFSSSAQEPVEKRTTLKVSGMSCGECAKTVEKETKKIEGVKTITVNQPKGEAAVTYDPAKTSPEAIAKTINQKTGFTAEVSRDPEKK
jgi:copper chaperone CopZ